MSMSKKDFIALADALRAPLIVEEFSADSRDEIIRAVADFCGRQNPDFMRDRWLGYLHGTNGPGGKMLKQEAR